MKSVLCLVLSLVVSQVGYSDEIDNIVKNAIRASARPCEVSKGACTKDCVCPNCTCDNCQCKPGLKCDNTGCQPLKRMQEITVNPCKVSVNGRVFVIKDMTPSEAMAAIKAQGDVVVFLDPYNRAVSPPSWYSVPMTQGAPMPQGVPVYVGPPMYTRPIYTGPTYGAGIGFGFGFQGPFGGGIQLNAGVG